MINFRESDGENRTLVCPKYENGKLVLRNVQLGANSYYSPHLKYGYGIAAYYKSYGIDDDDVPTLAVTSLGTTTNNSCWYDLRRSRYIEPFSVEEKIGWCNSDRYTSKIRGSEYDSWDSLFKRKNYEFDFSSVGLGEGTPAGGFYLEGQAQGFSSEYVHETLIAISNSFVRPTRSTRLIYMGNWSNYKPYNIGDKHLYDINTIGVEPSQQIFTSNTIISDEPGIPLVLYDNAGIPYNVWSVATRFKNNSLGPQFAWASRSTTNPVYIFEFILGSFFVAKILYERISFSMTRTY